MAESNKLNQFSVSQGQVSISGFDGRGASLPDLIGESLDAPATLPPGGSVTLSGSVRNIGSADVNGFVVGLFASPTRKLDASSVNLAFVQLTGVLSAGGVVPVVSAVHVPQLPAGRWYVGMNVDQAQLVVEANKNNNIFFADAASVVPAAAGGANLPDLISEFVHGSGSARAGDAIEVKGSIRNISPVDVGPFDVALVFARSLHASVGDLPLGRLQFPELFAGQAVPISASFAVPSTIAPGGYHVGMIVDPDDKLFERDEANNVAVDPATMALVGASGQGLPDLVAVDATVSATAGPGGTASFGGHIRNAGRLDAGPFVAAFSLRNIAAQPGAGGLRAGSVAVSSLSTGSTAAVSGTFQLPPFLQPGTYAPTLVADANNTIPENDKSNNAVSGPTRLDVGGGGAGDAALPDLVLFSTGATATTRLGMPFPVSATGRNLGAGTGSPFTVGFALSPAPFAGRDAIGLGHFPVAPPVPTGGTFSVSGQVAIPSFVTTGSYYIVGIADDSDAIAESNEANNVAAANAPIAVAAASAGPALPDLVVAGVNGPAGVQAGQTIGMKVTVRNIGRAPAANTTTIFRLGFIDAVTGALTNQRLELGRISTPPIPPDGFVLVSANVTVPSTVPPGDYFLGAIANKVTPIAESDSTNNANKTGSKLRVVAPGEPVVLLSFSKDPLLVTPGPLQLTARFTEPVAGTPTIDILRPGSGNSVRGAAMAMRNTTRFTFVYPVQVQDGQTVFDGPTVVNISARTSRDTTFPQPLNNVFNIVTTGRAALRPSALLAVPSVPSSTAPIVLAATVANDGGSTFGAVSAQFEVDGIPRQRYVVSIPPNATVTLPTASIPPLPAGQHRISVVLDPDGQLFGSGTSAPRLDRVLSVSPITAGLSTGFMAVSGHLLHQDGSVVSDLPGVVVINQRSRVRRTAMADGAGFFSVLFGDASAGDSTRSGDTILLHAQDSWARPLALALPNPPRFTLTDQQIRAGHARP
ncbi:MAG: hypothetical protein HY303_01640 [Candidatus Wallbacteria bacterium]|nr:hypothetical protein [Candidatus Wallbacteria bacterium]